MQKRQMYAKSAIVENITKEEGHSTVQRKPHGKGTFRGGALLLSQQTVDKLGCRPGGAASAAQGVTLCQQVQFTFLHPDALFFRQMVDDAQIHLLGGLLEGNLNAESLGQGRI